MAAVLPMAALLAIPAEAIPLQDLIDGGSITVDDKLFDDFRLIENSVNNDTQTRLIDPITGNQLFNLENIDVLPWDDTGDGPGLEFVSLNDELTIIQGPVGGGTGEGDLDFVFRVSVIDNGQACFPNCIKDNTLQGFFTGTDPTTTNFQDDYIAEIRERLFEDADLTTDPITLIGQIEDVNGVPIEKDVHISCDESGTTPCPPVDDQSGVIIGRIFAPREELWVLKDIRLLTTNEGETVAINNFNQHFSQVPESTTLALLGIGLAGFAFGRRRMLT